MSETEAVVRAALKAFESERWEQLMQLLDADFEVSSFLAPGRTLHGPEEDVRTLQAARATVYEVNVERYEPLDATTALGIGSVRVPQPEGGFTHHGATWLWTSRDGRLTAWFSYKTEEEARRSYAKSP